MSHSEETEEKGFVHQFYIKLLQHFTSTSFCVTSVIGEGATPDLPEPITILVHTEIITAK